MTSVSPKPLSPTTTLFLVTSLVLAVSCRGTWQYLSQTTHLREFLGGWESDNDRLRRVGLWTMGVAVCLHVYALLLLAAGGGFENKVLGPTGIEWPAQVWGGGILVFDCTSRTFSSRLLLR